MDDLTNTASRARSALGRGLRSLIPESRMPVLQPEPAPVAALKELAIETIRPNPLQPRQAFDEESLGDLVASIAAHGVLQPILVRQKEENSFEIVAGERRWRAARKAGLEKIPCILTDVADDSMLTLALVENIQRQDLNAIEEAESFRRLSEDLKMTQEQIAKAVGRDRATIANSMRLLKLPVETQALVIERRITMGHARALLSLQDTEIIQEVSRQIISEGMSVRKTEEVVQEYVHTSHLERTEQTAATKRESSTFVEREIRRQFEQVLGTKVELRNKNNKGTIVIHFAGAEQLNHLLNQLNVSIS